MFRTSPRLRAAGVALLLAAATGPVAAAESAADTQNGVWQMHDIRFNYVGFTSIYSCDGLADQLKMLLLRAGARADAKVSAGACARGSGQPDRLANARLVFYTLSPAPADAAAGDVVAAQWRKVAFSVDHPHELQGGDCELMEQFRDAVVKKAFATRKLVADISCVPHQTAGTRFSLAFETLVTATK